MDPLEEYYELDAPLLSLIHQLPSIWGHYNFILWGAVVVRCGYEEACKLFQFFGPFRIKIFSSLNRSFFFQKSPVSLQNAVSIENSFIVLQFQVFPYAENDVQSTNWAVRCSGFWRMKADSLNCFEPFRFVADRVSFVKKIYFEYKSTIVLKTLPPNGILVNVFDLGEPKFYICTSSLHVF